MAFPLDVDGEVILMKLHGICLRRLTTRCGKPCEGLGAAARVCRKNKWISNNLAKKLTQLDYACAWTRHASCVKAASLVSTLDAELAVQDSCADDEVTCLTEKPVVGNEKMVPLEEPVPERTAAENTAPDEAAEGDAAARNAAVEESAAERGAVMTTDDTASKRKRVQFAMDDSTQCDGDGTLKAKDVIMTTNFDNIKDPGKITVLRDEKVIIIEGPFPLPSNPRTPRVRVRVTSSRQTGWVNGTSLGMPLLAEHG